MPMLKPCNLLDTISCRAKLKIWTVALACAVVIIFGGRYVLSKLSTPQRPREWTQEEKVGFKIALSHDDLQALTRRYVDNKKSSIRNPFAAWEQSKNDRSVPLKMGTGSEALRNAEHHLFARAFVSAWDRKDARAVAGVGLFIGQVAWSLGKIFDDYSPPTAAEFQSGFEGIIDGYQYAGKAAETSTSSTDWYYNGASISSLVVAIAASLMLLVIFTVSICLVRNCWKNERAALEEGELDT